MNWSAPFALAARKLLIVPVLFAALSVVVVEAAGAAPADRGPSLEQKAPGGGLSAKPTFGGDVRRMR